MLMFQDDLVQDWPWKQYRTTTSYMGLSLAETAAEPSVKLEEEEVLSLSV